MSIGEELSLYLAGRELGALVAKLITDVEAKATDPPTVLRLFADVLEQAVLALRHRADDLEAAPPST